MASAAVQLLRRRRCPAAAYEWRARRVRVLQLIANDCYKMGAFYYAAKAFDVLERLDPDPEYWEGKRGACMGVFQQVRWRSTCPRACAVARGACG